MGPLLAILVAAAVIAGIWYGYRAAQKRREELFLFATELGTAFDPLPYGIHDQFSAFKPFGQGHSQESSNLISGQVEGIDWQIFDYKYVTGSGKNQATHHYQIIAAGLPVSLPALEIRPEGWLDKVAGLVGFEDINFESEAFSRRYHVKCDDRKVAYDVIHPRMIEYLLGVDAVHWQIRGTRLLLIFSGKCSVERLKGAMERVRGFISLIPGYVREDRGLQSERAAHR